MTGHKRKSKVFWTDEEMRLVAERAVELSFEDLENVWMFFSEAQEVLPAERRRAIAGRQSLKKEVIDCFSEIRSEFLERGVPVEIQIEKPVLVEPSHADVLERLSTEELLTTLVRRFARVLDTAPALLQQIVDRQRMNEMVTERPPTSSVTASTGAKPTQRRPRVSMIGFLPRQETDIKEKAATLSLELIFQRKDSLDEPPPSCQWCIMMIKVSHSLYHKVKRKFGQRTFVVQGATDALKQLADINARVSSGEM